MKDLPESGKGTHPKPVWYCGAKAVPDMPP